MWTRKRGDNGEPEEGGNEKPEVGVGGRVNAIGNVPTAKMFFTSRRAVDSVR